MKREERNEFNYIRKTLKHYFAEGILTYGATLSIRTDASREYKAELDELYTGYGFHPCSITANDHRFDPAERILYIFGLTFGLNGEEHPWTELYTAEEKARFEAALK